MFWHLLIVVSMFSLCWAPASAIFVDKGDPYKVGPLKVGQLTISKSLDKSPLHTIVFFPVEASDYPVVFFVGGYEGLVPSEMYKDFLTQLASHGFVVFGVDPHYPLAPFDVTEGDDVTEGADINALFAQYDWLHGYMENRTDARVAWNYTSLACHSAGCDLTMKMILQNHAIAQASVFLEPYSASAEEALPMRIPTLSYGTELSEKGYPQCAVAGKDWRQFYKVASCPKVMMEVKGFGHCDILDPAAWQACHDTHACTTTNNSRNAEYRQFVQGVVSAFLIGTLEGRTATLNYILNTTLVPLPLLDLQSELECSVYR
ncbi:uncharacterized protein LOC143283262 [Babylonia areolata]|uniref:uncharacterized protein LOC143283262 n=1 Tax=Babylonia areolata TaxID=304850 RepID=UPI003FD126F8